MEEKIRITRVIGGWILSLKNGSIKIELSAEEYRELSKTMLESLSLGSDGEWGFPENLDWVFEQGQFAKGSKR